MNGRALQSAVAPDAVGEKFSQTPQAPFVGQSYESVTERYTRAGFTKARQTARQGESRIGSGKEQAQTLHKDQRKPMRDSSRNSAAGALLAVGLVAWSGGCGGEAMPDEPLTLDYTTLHPAESRETPLQYARNDEEILRPLRNGVRMMTSAGELPAADRTIVHVQDERDVSRPWKLELDGVLHASHLEGETLYLVSSYRPRIPDLILPADTQAKREENERRIRSASAQALLPGYSENGGAKRPLGSLEGCLVAQQGTAHDSYTDLLFISAINVRTRNVSDVNCLSTNVSGVYFSRDSLYIAGRGFRPDGTVPITVLHKFAIQGGEVTYRATGAVVGTVPSGDSSSFMDEHDGDLRIVTASNGVQRRTVLRESTGQSLLMVSTSPNPAPSATPAVGPFGPHPTLARPEPAVLRGDGSLGVSAGHLLQSRWQEDPPSGVGQ